MLSEASVAAAKPAISVAAAWLPTGIVNVSMPLSDIARTIARPAPGCFQQGVPQQPVWQGPTLPVVVDPGSPFVVELNPELCNFLRCDVVVKTTFLSGDVMGGGSVSLSLFGGTDQGFVDVGPFTTNSTATYFPRRTLDTEADVVHLWGELPSISGDFLTDLQLVTGNAWEANPPPATLTVNVQMVGLGAMTKFPGSGGSYLVEVYFNNGGPAGGQGWSKPVAVDWAPG